MQLFNFWLGDWGPFRCGRLIEVVPILMYGTYEEESRVLPPGPPSRSVGIVYTNAATYDVEIHR